MHGNQFSRFACHADFLRVQTTVFVRIYQILATCVKLHRVYQKTSHLWLAITLSFDTHEQILIFLAEMLPIK